MKLLDMEKQDRPAGEILRSLRTLAGLTLQEVADGADTAAAYLSKVETGAMEPSHVYVARVTAFISASMLRAAA